MRSSLFLAAVAAGFVTLSSASAEDAPRSSTGRQRSTAPAISAVAVVAPAVDLGSGGQPLSATPAETPSVAPKADAPAKPAPPTLMVKINLSSQSMTLQYGGKRQETWKISSGRDGYLTPRGSYRPQWTARMWYSRKYDNAPMPHAVFFVGGVAVHGTQSTGLLGVPASHGCVRLAPGNAARFYALVHKHGLARTRIEVFGSTPASRIARQRTPSQWGSPATRHAQQRMASGNSGNFGWGGSRPAPRIQQYRNGLIYLAPNSPYRGRETFVYNGMVYRRVR